MFSTEKHEYYQNFISELLHSNESVPVQPQIKDSKRYSTQKLAQSLSSTEVKTASEAQQANTQGSRVKQTQNISEGPVILMQHGHWSSEQNVKYHQFLQLYAHHFIFKEKRRFDKIFKAMSSFIGSRQAEQCRSHHQKMQKKYHSFVNILLFLRKLHYNSENIEQIIQDFQKKGIVIHEELISDKQLNDLSKKKNKSYISSQKKIKNKIQQTIKKINERKNDNGHVVPQKLNSSQKQSKTQKEMKNEHENGDQHGPQLYNQNQNQEREFNLQQLQHQNGKLEMVFQFGGKNEDLFGEDYQHKLSFNERMF